VPDNIEPVPFLIALTTLVAIWLALGIRDRRRARRARPGVYLCGDTWHIGTVDTGVDWFICTRPYEHTGPCLDGVKRVIRR
jgi:hypothetical protein